ncbi:MAG: glycosyltransferase, partial [Candidatus Poribacteria bacterium]
SSQRTVHAIVEPCPTRWGSTLAMMERVSRLRSILAGPRYVDITEKLTECLKCRTVPIYLGCSNIEDHIPTECFIDYREFSGPDELDGFLREVGDDKYHAYVDSIDAWLQEGNLSEYHIWRLYDRLTELLADAVGESAAPLWREDTTWTPVSMPDEPPTRDVDADGSLRTWDEMNVAAYWTWSYLTRASLDDCAASVASIRETKTLGPAPRDDDEQRGAKPSRISRLLYIGVERMYGSHPTELAHNARNLLTDWTAWPGVEVHYIDPGTRVGESGVAGMSEELLEHVRSGDFDLVFCAPFARPLDVLHDTMREISLVTNTMVWAPYPPSQFETHSLPWASCADVVITTSNTDLRAFRAAGHPARLIKSQWAFSPRAYTRVRAQRQPIVAMVGKRTEMRGRLCEYLAGNGIDVEAYGRGWGNGRFLTETDFHRTFGESAINLNLDGRRRIYEVTGSGGFLMTTPVEGLDDAFVTDVTDPARAEAVVVNDVSELLDKTRYYLERPREREAIALRGYRRARAEHTWARRLADVCAQAGLELPPIVP